MSVISPTLQEKASTSLISFDIKDLLRETFADAETAAIYFSKNPPERRSLLYGAIDPAFKGKNEQALYLMLTYGLIEGENFTYAYYELNYNWVLESYTNFLVKAIDDKKDIAKEILFSTKQLLKESIEKFSHLFTRKTVEALVQNDLLSPHKGLKILRNINIERFRTVAPSTSDRENGFCALFVEAGNVCLVLLRRGMFTSSFLPFGYEQRSPFNHLCCYIDATTMYNIPGDHVSPMGTAGLVIYPYDDAINQNPVPASSPASSSSSQVSLLPLTNPDEENAQVFWKSGIYKANSLAIEILPNRFKPSPEIDHGFDYRYQTIVVRGHAKHVAGEMSALESLRGDLNMIITQAQKSMLRFDPILSQKIKEAHQKIAMVGGILSKRQFNLPVLNEEISKRLEELFKIAENINRLRLYEVNPATNEAIRKEKEKSKQVVDGSISPLIREGYFTQVVKIEEVEALELGVAAFQEAVAAIKEVALSSEQQELRAELGRAWETKAREFHQIVIEDGVTSAHGPIIRIYQETSIRTQQEILQGCWYLIGQVIDTIDQSQQEFYFPNGTYRQNLLELLEQEYTFFEANPDRQRLLSYPLSQYRQDITALQKLHAYWNQFEALPQEQVYLSSLDQVRRELSQRFDDILRNKLGGLNFQLLYPSNPSYSQHISEHLEEVLPLVLSRIALIDDKLRLAKLRIQREDRIHYMDPYYAEKRKVLDSQLFLMMNSHLLTIMTTDGYPSPSESMIKIADFLHSYVASERTYGPLESTSKFTTTSKEIAQFLNYPIRILDDIANQLSEIDSDHAKIFSTLSDQLSEHASNFDMLGNQVLEHLRKAPQDMLWWQQFKDLAIQQKGQEAQMHVTLNNIKAELQKLYFDPDAFSKQFLEEKRHLIASLKRIRALEPKSSALGKESNVLVQIAEQPMSAGRVNRGLIEAKESVSSLKSKLTALKKGTTPYDRQLRDQAVEKLDDVAAALIPDPINELFIRIKEIRKTLFIRLLEIPDLINQLKVATSSFSLSSIEGNEEEFLNALFVRIKDLSPPTKDLWKQVEFRRALSIIDQMTKNLIWKYCFEQGTQFNVQIEGLNLSVIKREWVNDRSEIVVTYSWMKNDSKEDPFFRSNGTHIRI